MDERTRFIGQWLAGELSMAELCGRAGVSRKTGYKWVGRYQADGAAGLVERAGAPHTHPQAISADDAETLLRLRATHPTWGARKLVAHRATEQPAHTWSAASRVGDLLTRHGLTVGRRRRQHAPSRTRPLAHADAPNAVWCADFKGWFRTGDGGLSPLSVWWVRLGIVPERIRPGRPGENGRHERLQRTLKAETATPPAASARAQQRAFDRWRHTYNEVRPHEALGQVPPARVYAPSPRPFPSRLPDLTYPAAWEVRRVRQNGQVRCGRGWTSVSATLAGQLVGLAPTTDGCWDLSFGPVRLGVLDERRGRLRPPQPAGAHAPQDR